MFADQRRACEAEDVHHSWDPTDKVCLYRGETIPREQAAEGPSGQAYKRWDMRRECLEAKGKHDGYEWQEGRDRCVFWGKVPRRAARSGGPGSADWKHFDIERECTRRGADFIWKPTEDGSGGGTCMHDHMPVPDAKVDRGRQWESVDYALMDLRRSCALEKNTEWVAGRCVRYGEPQWDQYGRRKTEVPLAAKYFAPRTPPTVVDGPVTPDDFRSNCQQKKKGVLTPDPSGSGDILCISPEGCNVVDQFGSRFDCVAASAAGGEPRLYGTYRPTPPSRGIADMFSPGGAPLGSNVKFTPPTVVDPKLALAQTGVEDPLAIGDADLHGKDVGRFAQAKPQGREWSEGVNRVNGENAVYFYNHATGQLKFEGPKHAPLTCNEDTKASGEVPGCNWERLVDLKSGEQYWKNLDSGEETWDDPLDEHRPKQQLKRKPLKPGTWSGTPGGNPYWTTNFAQASLGSKVSVFDVNEGWVAPSCSGATGDCMGYVGKGKNMAYDFDKFHAATAGQPFMRGSKGANWDEVNRRKEKGIGGALRQLSLRLAGRGKGLPWYGGQPYHDLVPSALGAIPSALAVGAVGARTQELAEVPHNLRRSNGSNGRRARQQRLAEIYGVQIADSAARTFFGTDFQKQYKQPSQAESGRYLAGLYAKYGNSTEDAQGSEKDATWPEKPKFGGQYSAKGRQQWCHWQGQMVPCQLGAGGAYYDAPVDTGVWGKSAAPNSMTMTGYGAWKLPHETARRQRSVMRGI
mmetsp:Transcript_11919/g.26806  ORF Transcript_11919/g.26806 Transcript_11919/m.26806 type:complete len:746 (+) Transcript_11919:956-3193(+)